jgi:hypothetical protein
MRELRRDQERLRGFEGMLYNVYTVVKIINAVGCYILLS